jgi:hypothetical protein
MKRPPTNTIRHTASKSIEITYHRLFNEPLEESYEEFLSMVKSEFGDADLLMIFEKGYYGVEVAVTKEFKESKPTSYSRHFKSSKNCRDF